MKLVVLEGGEQYTVNAEQVTWIEPHAAGGSKIYFTSGDYILTQMKPDAVRNLLKTS